MKIDELCPCCPIEVRGLYAVAYNLLNLTLIDGNGKSGNASMNFKMP